MGHDRGGGGVVLRDELPEPLEKLVVREMRQRVAVHGGSPRPSTVAGAGSKPTTTHRQGPEPFSRTTPPRAARLRSVFSRTPLPRAARLRSLSPEPSSPRAAGVSENGSGAARGVPAAIFT